MIKHFLEIELVRVRAANRELGVAILVADGGELHSKNAEKLCAIHNVIQKFTCYNTPENNAIIERVWRTIAEMAIAMLADSDLPEPFWEEARKLAVYIYNRIPPTREPEDNSIWQSPNDAFYQLPTHSSLKHLTIPFGSKVIAFIDKEKRLGKNHSLHGVECLFMGFEEDYIHGMRCYQLTTREFVTTNHLRVVATSDEYQLCPNDWPHIAKDTGSGKLGSLEEVSKSKPVTDFQYLIDTYHLDDEDGLLYKVTRVGKYKNYIVCWRRLVLSDGTLHKEDKLPIHAQDVADLTDLTGATLPTNTPLKPNNITWQDRSSTKNDTSGLEANGEGSAKDLPQSHSREIPSDYGKLTNGRRSSQSEHKKEVDLAPTGNKRKLDSCTPQAKNETRNHLSRSCNLPKNCDQPTLTPGTEADEQTIYHNTIR
jgi:hypothetical protein